MFYSIGPRVGVLLDDELYDVVDVVADQEVTFGLQFAKLPPMM
jgi:hypothetical protein